jgi:hypothetical protein
MKSSIRMPRATTNIGKILLHGTNSFYITQKSRFKQLYVRQYSCPKVHRYSGEFQECATRSEPAATTTPVGIIHNPPPDLVLPEKRPQAIHKDNALLRFNAQPLSCIQPIVGFLTVHDA